MLPVAADDGEKEVGREGRTRAKPTRSSNVSWITSGERDFLVLVVGLVACFEFHICERVLLFLVDSEMYAIQIGCSRRCMHILKFCGKLILRLWQDVAFCACGINT